MKNIVPRLNIGLLVLMTAGFFTNGCAYFRDRGNDAKDVIDIGVSYSKKPQFAFFYDFVPVIPIGVGYVDGGFIGLGGGEFAYGEPHYERSIGVILWGEEELTFNYSAEELEAMPLDKRHDITNFQRTGLIGLAQGPVPDTDYLISCPHYLHLGWIGLVATPRYLQMLDFVLGWTMLDIGTDDRRWEE